MQTTPEPTAPTDDRRASARADVAVLGLGAMGRKLAETFVEAGLRTTVWNRTAARATPLVDAGATAAADPDSALTSAPAVILCLLDHAATVEVLSAADATALVGRDVINLTSTTPDEALEAQSLVTARGARYLDGAIMVPTPMIGADEALFLFSGDAAVLDAHRDLLRVLGGRLDHLGEDAGLASTYDLGMLDIYLTGMAAYLHASALVATDGVTAERFLPYADEMVSLLAATLPPLAADVDRGTYPGDEDTTAMELSFAEHIVQASEERGVDTSLPQLLRGLLEATVERGHGAHGFSSVFEVLRNPGNAEVAGSQ
jgi:3-hydroxyisobutyrate dehydrogenase-like beta-hydroxyacid dehydrogenase